MVQFEAFKLKLDVPTVCKVTLLTIGVSSAEIYPSLFRCCYRREAASLELFSDAEASQ